MSFLFGSGLPSAAAQPVSQDSIMAKANQKLVDLQKVVDADSKESAQPSASNEVKVGTDAPPMMVKAGSALVAVGNKPKGRTKGRASKTGRKMVKMPPDGFLYNPTGRPAVWRTPINNAVFKVIQNYEVVPYATSSNTVTTFQAANFTVNSLDQISSLTAVFDQYRIAEVECWIEPRVSSNSSAGQNMGKFHTVVDYDDATVLSTVGQALDYANCVASTGFVGHYRRFKPHVAVAAYSGAFTSFANEEAPWIDAASPSVQHYGLKSVWTTTDVAYSYDMFVRLHTEWRNVR